MHKRKITPLLVAAIITAGVATGGVAGAHSYSNFNFNPEPQTFEENVSNTETSSTQTTPTVNVNKASNQAQNNTSKTTNKTEEQNTRNEETNTARRPNNSSKQSVKPFTSAESSYIYKPVSQEQTATTNTKNSVSVSDAKTSSLVATNDSSSNANHTLTLPSGNILVNGTPIKEQLQNDAQIDVTAKEITSGLSSSYEKAEALYVWVAKNITYNTTLEKQVMNNEATTDTSAISTFNSRNGICENFSTLYAVMANDAGLASRVVAGKGYANGQWIDHAWNEVYIPSMGWINVDCTFANSYTALVEKYNLPFNTEGLLSTAPYYNYSNQSYNYKIYTEDYFNTENFASSHIDGQVLAQLGNS